MLLHAHPVSSMAALRCTSALEVKLESLRVRGREDDENIQGGAGFVFALS